jgi:hypothetical protein
LAQLVHNYLNKLDVLDDTIKEDADNILSAIDLDELLQDPEGYLMALGSAFLEEHMEELERAAKEGKQFAINVLKKS